MKRVSLCEGNTTRTKLKHLDRYLLQIRNLFEQNQLNVYWVTGDDQLADILTEPLPSKKFEKLKNKLVISHKRTETKESQ